MTPIHLLIPIRLLQIHKQSIQVIVVFGFGVVVGVVFLGGGGGRPSLQSVYHFAPSLSRSLFLGSSMVQTDTHYENKMRSVFSVFNTKKQNNKNRIKNARTKYTDLESNKLFLPLYEHKQYRPSAFSLLSFFSACFFYIFFKAQYDYNDEKSDQFDSNVFFRLPLFSKSKLRARAARRSKSSSLSR